MCCAAHVKRLICGNLFLLWGCRTDVTIARLYRLTFGTQREQTEPPPATFMDPSSVFSLLHGGAVVQLPQLSTAWGCTDCIKASRRTLFSDSRSRGGVPVSSVPRNTLLRGVRVSGVGQLSCVPVSSVGWLPGVPVRGVGRLRCRSTRAALALPDGQSHQSPREVLSVAMNELRRAGEAKRFSRIARRLAVLADGRSERVTWSSRKSLRGVC
jgi:hypothetical protein